MTATGRLRISPGSASRGRPTGSQPTSDVLNGQSGGRAVRTPRGGCGSPLSRLVDVVADQGVAWRPACAVALRGRQSPWEKSCDRAWHLHVSRHQRRSNGLTIRPYVTRVRAHCKARAPRSCLRGRDPTVSNGGSSGPGPIRGSAPGRTWMRVQGADQAGRETDDHPAGVPMVIRSAAPGAGACRASITLRSVDVVPTPAPLGHRRPALISVFTSGRDSVYVRLEKG